MNSPVVPIRIPYDLNDALQDLADERKMSKSQVVRASILMAWPDFFQGKLNERYNQIMKDCCETEEK